jgi:dTDP-4-dehydrorhamnose 3,5-epimerase-like enzyme
VVKKATLIPVLITTDNTKRGVFFGWINPEDSNKDEIRAEKVQMCVYWSASVKGVLGLAAHGPDRQSKVTAPVKSGVIKGVTLVCEASEEAVKAWERQPWG